MKFQIIVSFIITFIITIASGRAINNGPTASESVLQRDSSLFNISAVSGILPEDAPAEFPIDFNLATGINFDFNVWADDALWNRYLEKGQHLVCLMEATDQGAGFLMQDTRQPPSASSRWRGDLQAERELWGWKDEQLFDEGDCDFDDKGLYDAFSSLGIDTDPAFDTNGQPLEGNNECFLTSHVDYGVDIPLQQQKYHVNGREYRCTGSAYEFGMNINDGVIIAMNIMSPSAAVQHRAGWGRKAEPGELPELQHLSDIYWGFWYRDNDYLDDLNYYVAHHVVNEDTVKLVTRAMRNKGKRELEPFPGAVFDIGTPEHQVIIASPIGATASRFLITHKPGLGVKRVTRIHAFHGDRAEDEVQLIFKIENVPEDQVTEPQGGQASGQTDQVKSNVLHVRRDGKHVLREHKVMANL